MILFPCLVFLQCLFPRGSVCGKKITSHCVQVNARKLRDELNVLDGLANDKLFIGVLVRFLHPHTRHPTTHASLQQASEALIQWVLVQFGGQAFNCVPLDWEQWGVCIGLGALGLLMREGLRRIPVE